MKKQNKITVLLSVALTISGTLYGCIPIKQESSGEVTTVVEIPAVTETANPAEESKKETTSPPKEIQAPHISREDFPHIDGSTATLPLSVTLYQLTTGASAQEAEAAIIHSKTTNAYMQLLYDQENTGLVIAYEPSEAVLQAMKDLGIKLTFKPIGKDALVFMANEGNPVKSLTEQQLVDIYRGTVRNWSEVGGEDKEIMAFQRPENSGSQTLMEKLVMKGVSMNKTAPAESIIGDMGELIEQVADYSNEKNALGYSVYYYARNMYEKPELRFMKVNGVEPSGETIKDGTYPYVNDFYAAIREDEPKDSKAYQLFDWLTGADGQKLVEYVGYVGVKETEIRQETGESEAVSASAANITFDQDERLLLDGQYAYGASGVMVLNDKMEITQVIRNVHLPEKVKMAELDDAIILDGLNAYSGIYSLRTGTWLVEPEYSSIYMQEDGTYIGYNDIEDKTIRIHMTKTAAGFELKEEKRDQLLSYLWDVKESEKKAVITDLNGNPVNEVNFAEYGDFEYGYGQPPYYIANYKDDSFVLFDARGAILFQKDDLGEEFLGQMRAAGMPEDKGDILFLEGVDGKGELLCGSYGGDQWRFIYDMKKKKVLTKPGVQIEFMFYKDMSLYLVTENQKTVVYGENGQPLKSTTGQFYSHVLDQGCYGYLEEGSLVVEDVEAGTRYPLPVKGVKTAARICGDVIGIKADTGDGIYKGGHFLMPGNNAWWWSQDTRYVVTDGKTHNLLMDPDGTILYESAFNEKIFYSGEELIVVLRGSYLYVIDYEGKVGLKLLRGYMGND